MRLKAILVMSLLFSVPFFTPVPAHGASPSGLGQFELGMDYERVKELLNRNGYQVVLRGEAPSSKELSDTAYLSREGLYPDYRFLYFANFQSEFGWPREQTGYTLTFGVPDAELKGVLLILEAKGKNDVERLRAVVSKLYSDLDRKFQRVSNPERDRALADSTNSSSVRQWVTSDGQDRPLRALAQKKGKKWAGLVVYIGEGMELEFDLPAGMGSSDAANVTEGETTRAQPPQLIEPQPGEETKTADTALTNEDVISLAASGMGDDLLVQLIEGSLASFSTDADALVSLKENGLSDRVISVMLRKAKGES
ncbi:MAG: hypothetical protein WBH85_11585 [Thermoanaerobaculia bacterium]